MKPSLHAPRLVRRIGPVATRLRCTPADVAALAVLVAGALAALGLLWWTSTPRREAASGPVKLIGGGATPRASSPAGGTPPAAARPVSEAPMVHVAGAVTSPGVYELPAESRVTDALDAAGGPLPDALLDAVNLARPVMDGEQLVVPRKGENDIVSAEPVTAMRPDGKLDLNRASETDLEELPGIGPVLAERIVRHRQEHGPFAAVGHLQDVPGIGEKLYAALADLVAV